MQSYVGMPQKVLSISEAEQQLQKNNLNILAEQYNISAAEAAVIQAKIWERPYFSGEINALNPEKNRNFDIGNNGQKVFAVQQLIYLGGKKKNEIAFAKSNEEIAKLQFEQLLRNLKYQLSQTFYGIYYDRLNIATIENQISQLDTLLTNYEIQSKKGNIALKEVVRLQSLVLNLKNEKNTLVTGMLQAQENLSLLTGVPETIIPIVNEEVILNKYNATLINKESILSLALEKNLDYATSLKLLESQELFLKWQKSLAVPDLTTGVAYDQRGGAFQNQVNITFGIPLNFWNSNRGNIKIAERQTSKLELNKKYKKLEIETKVETLWKLWLQQQNQFNSIHKSVNKNLKEVYEGIVNNFKKKNISMLEFTDFMESYNQTSIQINETKKSFISAGINLNYITNTDIF